MTGGVHDVDLGGVVMHGGVFGQNSNAALAFQVVIVHHALFHNLVIPVYAALFEQLVHQGGFAMVNMSNDGNVA